MAKSIAASSAPTPNTTASTPRRSNHGQNPNPPIETEEEFDRALARIWELFDSEPGTPEDAEHEILGELIRAYDDLHYPMDDPTPLAALEFRMDQALMTIDDLLPALGSKELAAAILAGQQEITPQIANALHQKLNIDLRDLLPQPAPAHP